jgi:hypothetical protein
MNSILRERAFRAWLDSQEENAEGAKVIMAWREVMEMFDALWPGPTMSGPERIQDFADTIARLSLHGGSPRTPVDAAFDKIAEGMADAVIALTNAREAERPAAGDQEDPGEAGLPERLAADAPWDAAWRREAAARYNAWGRLAEDWRHLERDFGGCATFDRGVMDDLLAEERQKL